MHFTTLGYITCFLFVFTLGIGPVHADAAPCCLDDSLTETATIGDPGELGKEEAIEIAKRFLIERNKYKKEYTDVLARWNENSQEWAVTFRRESPRRPGVGLRVYVDRQRKARLGRGGK